MHCLVKLHFFCRFFFVKSDFTNFVHFLPILEHYLYVGTRNTLDFLIRREAEWPWRILVPTLIKKFPLSFKTKREIGFVYSISPCFSLLSFAQLELSQCLINCLCF